MESELQELRQRLAQLEAENARLKTAAAPTHSGPLGPDEYRRYGRQMTVPGFGLLLGQLRLKHSRVLVVGAGGLGCPALLYLCGAGVGTLGILDDDVVDMSNLHRQVLHTTDTVGWLKCDSAVRHLARLNPHVQLATHPVRLHNDNAFGIVAQYDVVVDCTDNPATRYLVNDVCVLLGKTVVSGSGVKADGQLTVLNHANSGPCYRCFYPVPPRADSVSTCADAGVLGPAIGLTGVALAAETIKVLTGHYEHDFLPFLAMYSAYPQQKMRVFKMRNKQPGCAVCGSDATITRSMIEAGTVNYADFCGLVSYVSLPAEMQVSVTEAALGIREDKRAVVLDVRPKEQYQIVSIPGSVNVDWTALAKLDDVDDLLPGFDKTSDRLYVVCRYGNDSRLATKKLTDMGFKNVRDVKGGMTQWHTDVDPSLPIY